MLDGNRTKGPFNSNNSDAPRHPFDEDTVFDEDDEYFEREDGLIDPKSYKKARVGPKNLDYIFVSKEAGNLGPGTDSEGSNIDETTTTRVKVVQWLEAPDVEAVRRWPERLPNRKFPSDHIPLVVDLRVD